MLPFHLMWVAFVIATLQDAQHVLPSPSSFATWEYLGAMVDFPLIVQSLLNGSIYWCWLIFIPPLPIPIVADLLPAMEAILLILTCSFFAILTSMIFKLSEFPSKKSFCHNTMPATKSQSTMQDLDRNITKVLVHMPKSEKRCFRCTMLPVDSLQIMWKA